jgi:hypothetical protein
MALHDWKTHEFYKKWMTSENAGSIHRLDIKHDYIPKEDIHIHGFL